MLAVVFAFPFIHASAYTQNNWLDLVNGWPIDNPDSIDILNIENSEDLGVTLIRGDTWWYRPMSGSWISGKISLDGNSTSYPLPLDRIDSYTGYYRDHIKRQMESRDTRYWVRDNVTGGPWYYTGILSDGEVNSGSCPRMPPSTIDTLSVFPMNGKSAITVTKDGWYWYKEDINIKNFPYCGPLITDGTSPVKFSGETDFYWKGQLVQLATSGNRWWLWPKPGDHTNYYSGIINSMAIDKIAVSQNSATAQIPVNKNIFGVNLVWHNPHTAPDIGQIEAKIRELGVKSLRFPGGCGGDSFNWESKTGIPGSGAGGTGITFDNYIQIIKNTGVEPLYTLNLEGTTWDGLNGTTHVNQNCHSIYDYPGTLDRAVNAVSYLKNQGINLNYVEVGNEPWAANGSHSNWQESWTSGEYIAKLNDLKSRMRGIYPNLNLIAAIHGSYRFEDWTKPLATAFGNSVYYQAHIYRWGSPEADDWSTQWQSMRTELANRKQQLIDLGVTNPVFSMSEYNLYCWQGVDGNGYTYPNSYPVDPYTQKTGGAFYLADAFKEMMLAQINSAMIWHLIGQSRSNWTCGILQEDGNGNYNLTPAAEVFKLYAGNTLSNYYKTAIQDYGIDVVTTANTAGYANTFLINKTANFITANLAIATRTDQGIELISLKDNSADYKSTNFSVSSSFLPQYPSSVLLSPRSINLIKTVPSTNILPTPTPTNTPIPTATPTSTPISTPTNTPTPTPTSTPTPTPTSTPIPTNTPTPTPTITPTLIPTSTPIPTPTRTPTPSPTITPKPTSTPIPSPTITPTPTTPPADANGDGKVDTADMTRWFFGYQNNLSGVSNGDFNTDSKINGLDYISWLFGYGK
jgi:hypothetical protein